jgi:hypothetical protein
VTPHGDSGADAGSASGAASAVVEADESAVVVTVGSDDRQRKGEPHDVGVVQISVLPGDDGVDQVGHPGGDHDPGVPLELDVPLLDAQATQPIEVVHDALRQRQVLPRGQPGEPLTRVLQPPDLGTQVLVDLPGPLGEPLRVGVEELLDPSQRNASTGQRMDPDQSHHGGRVVGPVAGVVTLRLRQPARSGGSDAPPSPSPLRVPPAR